MNPAGDPSSGSRWRWTRLSGWLSHPVITSILLGLITLVAFWSVTRCEFTTYDDPQFVTGNVQVQQGLTLSSLKWAFTTSQCANWHPLTWISHMIDVELFGLRASWHHLMNLLLHLANTIVLFLALRQLTGTHWRSAAVAMLFALHPAHVESVAWVAERKDVLSALFWMLALWAYARYAQAKSGMPAASPADRRASRSGYGLVLLFFLLGLMSKPMVVTLPFVLLLLDYWPLNRLLTRPSACAEATADKSGALSSIGDGGEGRGEEAQSDPTASPGPVAPAPASSKRCSFAALVVEKIPLFVLSAVFCVVTFFTQERSGAVATLARFSLLTRIENALISYVRYVGKLFWPTNLVVPYPYDTDPSTVAVIASAVLLGVVCVVAWYAGRRWGVLRTGWFWFVGTLIPVIGLVQVGSQALADRYTYLPSIGLFLVVVWGFAAASRTCRLPAWGASVIAVAAAGACIAGTRHQVGYWTNSETLFRHTIALTRNNGIAYNNLGQYLLHTGRIAESMKSYEAALRINPKDAAAYDGVGCCFFQEGKLDDAIRSFQRSLEIRPDDPGTLFNLGSAYGQRGDYAQAIAHFQRVLRIKPGDPDAQASLGNVYSRQNRCPEAVACYQAVLRLMPKAAYVHSSLGGCLYRLGQTNDAVRELQLAVHFDPNNPDFRVSLARVLRELGQRDEAIVQLREALRLRPRDPAIIQALMDLGIRFQ